MSLLRISESNDCIVDYDRDRGMYRVSFSKTIIFKMNIGLMLMKK